MKTYISDLIPKLQKFSQKLDNLTLLTNQHWVVVDTLSNNKNVYIFRANNELLISQNGKVEKARWEYLGNNSLLIDKKDESYLFKHGFFDSNILALKVDSKNEYAFLINENKYDGELNSIERIIDFLTSKYLSTEIRTNIEIAAGIQADNTINHCNIVYPIKNFEANNSKINEVPKPVNFKKEVEIESNSTLQILLLLIVIIIAVGSLSNLFK